MPKKLNTSLPAYIDLYSTNRLIEEIELEKQDVELPWNSFGGSIYGGQQFIDFLNKNENKVDANVSGIAASMGAVALPFFNKVIGANQADVMIHSLRGGAKSTALHTNTFLYKALAKKIDEAKFEEITGKKLKQVMLADEENRVDVWITGKQAAYIGLFDEAYDLLDKAATLESKVDFDDIGYKVPDNILQKFGISKKENTPEIKNVIDMEIKNVTAEELKSGNPTVYKSILDAGKKAEQERVDEIMEYAEHDMDKANAIIKSGESLSKKDVAHFVEKKFNAEKIDKIEKDSEGNIIPAKKTANAQTKKTEAEEKTDALDEVDELSGVNSQIQKDK